MGNEIEDRIYIYGLSSENRVMRYSYVPREDATIGAVINQATILKDMYPGIVSIYAVDNSYDIYCACRDSMKTNLESDRVIFKVMLERLGVRIL